jgi:DNA-binding CsgD family transcriptional regulator
MPETLSAQERNIIACAADGLTDKETALSLGITVGTVRTYWERIRTKLKTTNRTHSVAVMLRYDFKMQTELPRQRCDASAGPQSDRIH